MRTIYSGNVSDDIKFPEILLATYAPTGSGASGISIFSFFSLFSIDIRLFF